MGRLTDFTPEIGTELCSRLISVGSLRKVCESDDMPDKSTVFRWLAKGDEHGAPEEFSKFRDQYAKARKLAKEYRFDEHWEDLEETAKTPLVVDDVPLKGPDGEIIKVLTPQSVAFARLKHDAFKWQASKEDPKKYGDVVRQELTGEDGGPIKTQDVSITEAARRIAFVLASGAQGDDDDATH